MEVPRNDPVDTELLEDFPLDMKNTSVDDMLWGCSKDTLKKVQKTFSKSEKKEFAEAWGKATSCALKKLIGGWNKGLDMKQLKAICVYTGRLVYQQFNNAVRSQRREYGSNFKFHYLFVLLTSAVQTLKLRQPCYTTYRRCSVTFSGTVGQRMRFGSFTSTSVRTNLIHFGRQTCFQMTTCFGANVQKFSVYPNEDEVLIPPYEEFEITSRKVKEDKDKPAGLEDCEVVFVLKTVGWKSEQNCKLVAS